MKKLALSALFTILSISAFAIPTESTSLPLSKTCYSAKGKITCGSGNHDSQYYDTGCFDTQKELDDYLAELGSLVCGSIE